MATVNPVKGHPDKVGCDTCGAEWSIWQIPMHHKGCPSGFKNVVASAPEDGPVKSDGGSSAYYKLPPQATDLMDLIEAEEMSFARGNMFKALFRLGKKAGTDVEYDLNKLQWFLDRMREMHGKGQRL